MPQYLDSAKSEYDISVCIICYNKENYIRQTIESVLSQKTSCSVEIVIGDNASTDKSPDILREYWDSNNEKFSIILNEKNLGLCTNQFNTLSRAKGKYIVILYGDDYWINEKKLQTQYEYMEKNPSIVGVSTTTEMRIENSEDCKGLFPPKYLRNNYVDLKSFMTGNNMVMGGLMFRNSIFKKHYDTFSQMPVCSKKIDDLSFCIFLLMFGNVYNLDLRTDVYRISGSSYTHSHSKVQLSLDELELISNLDEFTKHSLDFDTRIGMRLVVAFYHFLSKQISYKEYKKILDYVPERYKSHHAMMLKGWRAILKAKIFG